MPPETSPGRARARRGAVGVVVDLAATLVGGPLVVLLAALVLLAGGWVVTAVLGVGAPGADRTGLAVAAGWATVTALGAGTVLIAVRLVRRIEVPAAVGGPGSDAPAGAPWWPGAIEVLLGAVLVAVLLWPVTPHPDAVLAGGLDAPYHAWLGWRLADLWRSGHALTWVIPDAVAPMGLDLRLIDGLVPGAVDGVWNLVTGGRMVLAYNLTLATGLALDLWAGRALGRELSGRRAVWFVTGVAFTTAPMLTGALGAHIAFVWAFTLPLLVRAAVRIARGGAVHPVRLGLLLVVAFGCSAYHLIFGALAFAVVLVAWPGSAVWRRATGRGLLAALAVAAVLLAPFVAARLGYEADERAAGSPEVVHLPESLVFSADALGVLAAPDSRLVDLPVPRPPTEPELYARLRPAFLGFLLLGGLGLLVVTRSPARRPLLVASGALWLLTLGPVLRVGGEVSGTTGDHLGVAWLPFRVLLDLPGLGALRAPNRAGYALAAVLAGGLALGFDALLERRARPLGRTVVWAWAALALVATLTGPLPVDDLGITPVTRAGLEEVARRADGTVDPTGAALLIVPWGCRPDDPRVLALQSIHHRPSIGCNPPPTATRWYSGLDPWVTSAPLAALRCDPGHVDRRAVPFGDEVRLDPSGLEDLRRDLGVRFVVIDRGLLPSIGCDGPRDALALLDRYEAVSDDGTWRIVDLDRPRPVAPVPAPTTR